MASAPFIEKFLIEIMNTPKIQITIPNMALKDNFALPINMLIAKPNTGVVAFKIDIVEAFNFCEAIPNIKNGRAELKKAIIKYSNQYDLILRLFWLKKPTIPRKIEAIRTLENAKISGPKTGIAILINKNDEPHIAAKVNNSK